MAIFKNASGQTLDTSKYTNLAEPDAIKWAQSQDLFKGYTMEQPKVETNLTPAPITPENKNLTDLSKNLSAGVNVTQESLNKGLPADKITEPQPDLSKQVVKNQNLISKINESYTKLGGNAIANEAFIQAVAQAKYGRSATEDELGRVGSQYGLVGAKLSDVLKRFGLNDQISNFGIEKQEETKPTTVDTTAKTTEETITEPPKTVAETLADMMKNYQTDLDKLKTDKGEELGITELTQEATDLKGELDKMKANMDFGDLTDVYNKQMIAGKPILTSAVSGLQGKYTNDQLFEKATQIYQYNSKLVDYNIAKSNLDNARQIVKETAQDYKDMNTQKLNMLQLQNQITQSDRAYLEKEIDREYEMAQQGYVHVQSPSALQALAKEKGAEWVRNNTINISGKIYIKPAPGIKSTITAGGKVLGLDDKGNVIKDYGAADKEKVTFGKIGVDEDGKDIMGFIDTASRTTTPVSGGDIKDGQATSSIGNITITGANGSDKWQYGLDVVIEGGKGADVKTPFSGTVIFAGENGGFGNQVKIKLSDGSELWMSHLDSINVKNGDTLTPNTVVGKQGNTGDVYSNNGGDGTHVDLTIKKPDGTYYSAQEVGKLLGVQQKSTSRTFDTFAKEQTALSVLPAQLRNSDKEGEKLLKGIRQGLKEGKEPYEIADTLMGYKVNKPDIFSDNIRQYMALSPNTQASDPSSYARLINSGNKSAVVNKLETNILKGTDGKPKEELALYTEQTGGKVYLEAKALANKLGIVAGNWNDLKKKFFADKDYQKLKSDLTAFVQDWRKKQSGVAVTETELKMLDDLLPAVTDNPINLMQKIESFNDMMRNSLNSTRQTYGLPILDRTSLRDINARVKLYENSNLTPSGNANDPEGIL